MKLVLSVLVLLSLTSLPVTVTGACISNDSVPVESSCNMILISRSLHAVKYDPQVIFNETPGCQVTFEPTARYGSSTLEVKISTNYQIQIDLPSEIQHPPDVYDIQLSLVWQETGSSQLACKTRIEVIQNITIYLVDAPIIRQSQTKPSSGREQLNCELSLDLTPRVATKFERNKQFLGYCGKDKQTFAGGYEMQYSEDQRTCILKFDDKLTGNYTCTAIYQFYGSITSEITTIPHIINKSNSGEIIGLSVGVGVAVLLSIIFAAILLGIGVKYGCCRGVPCHR